jgi:hypothetical protein
LGWSAEGLGNPERAKNTVVVEDTKTPRVSALG